MFKIIVISTFVTLVSSRYYSGGKYPSGGGGGGGGGGRNRGQYTGSSYVPATIHSKHLVEYRDTPSSGMAIPTTIDVPFNTVPMNIIFRSASTKLNIAQQHQGTNGQTQMTHSDDGPIKIIHRVQKPIIQEIREIISPYRKITQEIMPVQEEIQTIVARGAEQQFFQQQQQQQQQRNNGFIGDGRDGIETNNGGGNGNSMGSYNENYGSSSSIQNELTLRKPFQSDQPNLNNDLDKMANTPVQMAWNDQAKQQTNTTNGIGSFSQTFV